MREDVIRSLECVMLPLPFQKLVKKYLLTDQCEDSLRLICAGAMFIVLSTNQVISNNRTGNISYHKCLHTRRTHQFQMKLLNLDVVHEMSGTKTQICYFPCKSSKTLMFSIFIRLNETWRFQKYFEFFIFMKKVYPSSKKL